MKQRVLTRTFMTISNWKKHTFDPVVYTNIFRRHKGWLASSTYFSVLCWLFFFYKSYDLLFYSIFIICKDSRNYFSYNNLYVPLTWHLYVLLIVNICVFKCVYLHGNSQTEETRIHFIIENASLNWPEFWFRALSKLESKLMNEWIKV